MFSFQKRGKITNFIHTFPKEVRKKYQQTPLISRKDGQGCS